MARFFSRFTSRVNDDADDIGTFFRTRKGVWIGAAVLAVIGVGIVWSVAAQIIEWVAA